jgi:hypothetical protein
MIGADAMADAPTSDPPGARHSVLVQVAETNRPLAARKQQPSVSAPPDHTASVHPTIREAIDNLAATP